jgi:5-methylcytosine-specific restriction endonuclease McrA
VKPPKTRNNGQWTEAKYRGFVRSALRTAWMKWPPNQATKKNARVARGLYTCEGYQRSPHTVQNSIKIDGKRRNNIFTDHIVPVGSHVDWNATVEGMFAEADNLQLLCKACHDLKTKHEREALREAKK